MGKGGEAPRPVRRTFAWKEVQEHRQPDDAWVVYHNKVYDVSGWHDHPGGGVIFTHAGDDMTDIFAAFHAAGSHSVMDRFYIGDLLVETTSKTPAQVAFEKGYRDLRSQMVMMGLFKSNPYFYVYKCVSNMMLWGLAVALVYYTSVDNVLAHVLSALIVGLFFQQCGWLAHDFLHHQVFQGSAKNRKYGDYAGIYWGNLMQGYSVQWWKNKHNGHHAVPNLHNSTETSQDGDPDIDTMPVLAWSLQQARNYTKAFQQQDDSNKNKSPMTQFMIRHQAFFYFPILLLARLSWLNESFKLAFGLGAATQNAADELKRKGIVYPILERSAILLHYVWMFTLSSGFGRFSLLYSTAYFLLATCSCGLMLATVFGLGHNGMAVYDADMRPDFWKLQVTTTRNVIGGHGIPQAFVDWFCGGLQYQVDHHLFPTLPRHSLRKAHALVKSFCHEHNVTYHEADMVDGTMEVLLHLHKVADQFVTDFVLDGPTM
jgi:acyl-lipid Delta6-acetylenase / acyl-lipid (9-3)-desaturase